MLEIKNHGPLILSSNYWDLPAAKAGKILVSCNAGAFRVLLPATQEGFIPDMTSARGCAVSRGPWPEKRLDDAFEVLFDDGTSNPFALHLARESFDRIPEAADAASQWVLTVWTGRRGKPRMVLERPCHYRLAKAIPDLRPWTDL